MARPFAARRKLSPSQARTVAGWRLDDARCLRNTGLPKHMNGAVYLAGLVLDCLLKAHLLEKYRYLAWADQAVLGRADLRRWNLIYRLHDLDGLLAELPDLLTFLQGVGSRRTG